MSGMDESLSPQKSRITIYDEPVICSFFSHDVYIPLFGAFAIILVLPIITVVFLSYDSTQERMKKELLFSADQNVAILDTISCTTENENG